MYLEKSPQKPQSYSHLITIQHHVFYKSLIQNQYIWIQKKYMMIQTETANT